MPIGAPGWPELACCTASIASARIVLAIRVVWSARGETMVAMRAGFRAHRVPAHQACAMLGRLATRSRQNFRLSSPAGMSIFAMAT